MHWQPTHDDQIYMDLLSQSTLQDLQMTYSQLQVYANAAELPDRWLEPQRFTAHREGVLMCGILRAAIEGATGAEGSDPRLPHLVVNGETDHIRALLGLTQAAPLSSVARPPAPGRGVSSGVTSVNETTQVAAPAKRAKHPTTMRQQMDQYNDLVRYAHSINLEARLLGGPEQKNTFASWDQGEKAMEKLKARIREHEAKGEEGGGHGAG